MLAAVAVASCAKDAPDYPGNPDAKHGTLVIQSEVKQELAALTRAGQVNLHDLGYTGTPGRHVLVTSLDNTSFNDVVTGAEKSGLEPGRYMVTIGSESEMPDYVLPGTETVVKVKNAPRHANRSTLVPLCKEGVNMPYFEGHSTVEVKAGVKTPAKVTMAVANTVVRIRFTERFRNYFENGAVFTLKTKAGFSGTVSYTKGTVEPARYFYVQSREFTISGTARRQDPSPGIIEAKAVTIEPYTVSGPARQTLYTYTFDVEEAGSASAKVGITVNAEPVGTIEYDIDLNPNPEGR